MKHNTVIIGAGISGLMLARDLAGRGARVQVLEKSRGVGGRMSTKRVGSAVFDQGAQFFTVGDEQMEARVACWERCGVVARWPGGELGEDRWVAKPSMTGLAKALGRDLNVSLQSQVQSVRHHDCGCWEIDVAGGELVRAERLVLSSPVPQSLALLDAGEVDLPAGLRTGLESVSYHSCLALMVILDGPSKVPAGGACLGESGNLNWVADNVRKGIVQSVPGAVTFYASRSYSQAHYAESEEQHFAVLMDEMRPWLGDATIVGRQLHRWRYSEPRTKHTQLCVWEPGLSLGFCGDGFGGRGVEGAALSGLALAREISATLEDDSTGYADMG